MNIKEIEYVLTIARLGSISKAAEHLYVSQPALSLFLKKFETEFGIQVFSRTLDGVEPTSAGLKFIEAAEKINDILNQLNLEIFNTYNAGRLRIKMGVTYFRGSEIIPLIVHAFQAAMPMVELIVQEERSAVLDDWVSKGLLDITVNSSPFSKSGLSSKFIFQEEIFVCGPLEHPLFANGQSYVDADEMVKYDFVSLNRDYRLYVIAELIFKPTKAFPRIVHYTNTMSTAVNCSRQGLGLTLVPHYYVLNNPNIFSDELFACRSIGKSGYFRDVRMCYNPKNVDEPFAEKLCGVLKECFANL